MSAYFNMTWRRDTGHSCGDVRSDKDLMQGECGLLICRGFFKEAKWLWWQRVTAGIWENVHTLIYIKKQLQYLNLPYCNVVKPNYPASTGSLEQIVVHRSGICFSFHRIISGQYLALATIRSILWRVNNILSETRKELGYETLNTEEAVAKNTAHQFLHCRLETCQHMVLKKGSEQY